MYQHIARHDKQAAEALVAEILKRGYSVSVHDGDEGWAIAKSTDAAAILAEMGEMDSDYLRVRDASGKLVGAFSLIYGNDSGETIADHSDNSECESIFKAVVAE